MTPIVKPLTEDSAEGFDSRSTPATAITPGIEAGADTCSVPSDRFPTAATTTTSFSKAYKNASSQLFGQETEFLVRERFMTVAPLSTAQIMPSAI